MDKGGWNLFIKSTEFYPMMQCYQLYSIENHIFQVYEPFYTLGYYVTVDICGTSHLLANQITSAFADCLLKTSQVISFWSRAEIRSVTDTWKQEVRLRRLLWHWFLFVYIEKVQSNIQGVSKQIQPINMNVIYYWDMCNGSHLEHVL